MKFNKKNRKYQELASIGTVEYCNRTEIDLNSTSTIGVAVSQSGKKKRMVLDLVMPTRRNWTDSRTTAHAQLDGRQARQLFETLRAFYETRSNDETESQ